MYTQRTFFFIDRHNNGHHSYHFYPFLYFLRANALSDNILTHIVDNDELVWALNGINFIDFLSVGGRYVLFIGPHSNY